MCRVEVTYDMDKLPACAEDNVESITYQPDSSMRKWQQQMEQLRARQRARGGLIDLEKEKNKYLLSSVCILIEN